MAYEPRFYRRTAGPEGLTSFRVVVAETDLLIHAARDLSEEAETLVRELRAELERYIAAHPRFAESFVPVDVDATAPEIAREMSAAATAAGVGPMAAVAGAFAERVARSLVRLSPDVIVENGGDVFVMGDTDRTVALWAGASSPATLGLLLRARSLPRAVATSSGTIGPSVSLGRADAATVIASTGALADAAASVVGNRVHAVDDIEAALEAGRLVEGVLGVVVSVDGHTGAWGEVEFVPVEAL